MGNGAKSSALTFVTLCGWMSGNLEHLKQLPDIINPSPALRIKKERKSKNRAM